MNRRDIKTLGDVEARLLLSLASQGNQVFTTDDAQAALGGARHRVNKLLAQLSNKRWLLRLQRRLYLILPFEAGMDGSYSHHPFFLVPYLTTPHTIAYWTALSHYNYTEQIPGTIFVATTTQPTSAELTIDELGLQYRFVTLVPHKFFGNRRIWIDGHAVTITDQAKTVVDCLDHPETLAEYAECMKNRTIFKRMGYLVEVLGLLASDEIEPWRDSLSAGYTLLDPLAGDHGSYNSRWRLRLNRTTADLTDWIVH
jgi:predicted transcriptional regulator of viral defense system